MFWSLIVALLITGAVSFRSFWDRSLALTSNTHASLALRSSNFRLVVVSRYSGPTYPEEPSVEKVIKCWSGVPPRTLGFDVRPMMWVVHPARYGHIAVEVNLFVLAGALVLMYLAFRFFKSRRERFNRAIKELMLPSGAHHIRVVRYILRAPAFVLAGISTLLLVIAMQKLISFDYAVERNYYIARLNAGNDAYGSPTESFLNDNILSLLGLRLRVDIYEFQIQYEVSSNIQPIRSPVKRNWDGFRFEFNPDANKLARQATLPLLSNPYYSAPTIYLSTHTLAFPSFAGLPIFVEISPNLVDEFMIRRRLS